MNRKGHEQRTGVIFICGRKRINSGRAEGEEGGKERKIDKRKNG
jgi:hypothetical protein